MTEFPSFKDAKMAFERRYVAEVLAETGGDVAKAARLAKKDRSDFYMLIKRTQLNPNDFRPKDKKWVKR